MSWTAGVADSIGVAEDAFRLIMGMCFGKWHVSNLKSRQYVQVILVFIWKLMHLWSPDHSLHFLNYVFLRLLKKELQIVKHWTGKYERDLVIFFYVLLNNCLWFSTAYPVMLVHNLFVKRQPATVQHVYFVATGMALAYWALGSE